MIGAAKILKFDAYLGLRHDTLRDSIEEREFRLFFWNPLEEEAYRASQEARRLQQSRTVNRRVAIFDVAQCRARNPQLLRQIILGKADTVSGEPQIATDHGSWGFIHARSPCRVS